MCRTKGKSYKKAEKRPKKRNPIVYETLPQKHFFVRVITVTRRDGFGSIPQGKKKKRRRGIAALHNCTFLFCPFRSKGRRAGKDVQKGKPRTDSDRRIEKRENQGEKDLEGTKSPDLDEVVSESDKKKTANWKAFFRI